MGFDDNFFQLPGIKTGGGNKSTENNSEEKSSVTKSSMSSLDSRWASDYGNSDSDYVIESKLITPKIKAVKDEESKPLVIVVDDDFETLDLLKIFLQRDYRYEGFSGPREAIFYLNQHVPDLVLVDCKIHTMKALTFIEIIRTGVGNVPFVLTGTEEELATVDIDFLPEYVVDTIKRPISRGNLQEILDKYIKKDDKES